MEPRPALELAVIPAASPAEQSAKVATLASEATPKPSEADARGAARESEASLASVLASLPSPSHSTSTGSPSNGALRGGVALPLLSPGLRYNDRRSQDARFGTTEIVAAIVRAAARVAQDFSDSELVVNDIGLEAGGAIAHHGSHRAGRDADILFYLLGDDGKPTPSVGAPLGPDGIGFDYKDLSLPEDDVRVHFDAARTWRFIAALIEDESARVQRIFVVEHLRDMLLQEASRVAANPVTLARFADMTCQPSYPHDDHLHVRWYCSDEDVGLGCEDLPPVYPWRAEELAARGLTPVLAKAGKAKDPAPVVTQKAAEQAVKRQKPHPSVLAFLAQRKAWEKQPHPGRPYCR